MTRNPLFTYRGAPPSDPNKLDAFEVYEHLRDSRHTKGERRLLARLWRQFECFGLADPDFLDRFPFECPSRMWEMHLADVFTKWNWKLIPSRRFGHGPDFGIQCDDGHVMWVEATAPTGGTTGAAVPTSDRVTGGALDRALALRYLGAIAEKRQQYARWRADDVVAAEDGLLIAISGSRIGWANADYGPDPPRIVASVFAIGDPTITVPISDTNESPRRGPTHVQDHVLTSRGGDVRTDLFLGCEAAEVSAVLFCANHIKNRPRTPGKDFVLVRNPFARRPFPADAMKAGQQWQLEIIGRRAGAKPRPFYALVPDTLVPACEAMED